MVTIYNYTFTMLGDCVVTLFELLTHILNIHNSELFFFFFGWWVGGVFAITLTSKIH